MLVEVRGNTGKGAGAGLRGGAADFIRDDDMGGSVDQLIDEIVLAAHHQGRDGKEKTNTHRHTAHRHRRLPAPLGEMAQRNAKQKAQPGQC